MFGKRLFSGLFFLSSWNLLALPIGFGINQGNLDYLLRSSEHFRLYHDARYPHEAEMILRSLEAIHPIEEEWMGIQQGEIIPIISSAETSNASFANPITDAMELQTEGSGEKELFWHEYTHLMMYRHLQNFFGPSGAILHLPWMPAWFIEGLAETFSVSIGSDAQGSLEKYYALTGEWPSFDRLHSLYNTQNFAFEGYAISGAFVRWLLTDPHHANLPKLLQEFYSNTLPWNLPQAFNPFSSFLPMDGALESFLQKNGRDLYEDYKKEMEDYWTKRRGPKFTGLEAQTKPTIKQKNVVQKNEFVTIRLQKEKEQTKICSVQEPNSTSTCFYSETYPSTLSLLGNDGNIYYFLKTTFNLTKNIYSILQLDATSLQVSTLFSSFPTQALSVVKMGSDRYLWLATTHGSRKLIQTDASGQCKKEYLPDDFVEHISLLTNQKLLLTIYAGKDKATREVNLLNLPWTECTKLVPPTSPLEYALAWKENGRKLSLNQALQETNPLYPELYVTPPEQTRVEKEGQSYPEQFDLWRPRFVAAFPWLAADDPQGVQVGILTIPLMDEMQNETLKLALLYGVNSHFPNVDVSLLSTRFSATTTLSAFHRQIWNGYVFFSNGAAQISYLMEEGGRLEFSMPWWNNHSTTSQTTLGFGLLSGYRKPYLGYKYVVAGQFNEPFFSINWNKDWKFLSLNLGANGKIAPAFVNSVYDYNQLGFSSSVSFLSFLPFDSSITLGIEGARTRGKIGKTPLLKQAYVPLKTFLAGSGGGYNNNNFPLFGEGSLFVNRFGDTQGRMKADLKIPIVKDLEKLWWIFYFQNLNFNVYYNYGGAWKGSELKWDRFIPARGYSLDLYFDNKGIKFNTGLGMGQVLGESYQGYYIFGFDALF